MSRQWIVTSPHQVPLLSADQLLDAAKKRFGERLVVSPQTIGRADFHLYVTPEGDREFTISHYAEDLSVSFEATEEQSVDLAAWLRSLLPADFPRVIVFDQGWLGHAELTYGITPSEIRSQWVDHTEPGWNAGDPDLG